MPDLKQFISLDASDTPDEGAPAAAAPAREEVQAFVAAHWGEVLADIDALLAIESVRDDATASVCAPYGAGPAAALERILALAEGYGFTVQNCDGHIGIIDLPGEAPVQVGIIGHVDVVAAGGGWDVPPFALTRKEGYLLGRGVLDDKGPLLLALYAMRFWKERGVVLPYTIRLLVGTCEETTMEDVAYYLARFDEPAFLFSPDGQFPVVYGEGGIAQGTITSAPLEGGDLMELAGGQAINAVPDAAYALVRAAAHEQTSAQTSARAPKCTGEPLAEGSFGKVTVTRAGEGLFRVEARGISAHASLPWEGENAIGTLVDFLMAHDVGTPEEREFLELVQSICHNIDGSTLGIDCSDEHFGDLTVVASMIAFHQDALQLSLDIRYPSVITSAHIVHCLQNISAAFGATFELSHDAPPFVMNPQSPQVHALLSAYCEVTGKEAAAITSKGGTYARLFTCGVSFGPDRIDEAAPAWVGGLHGANEGVSETFMKEALEIYICALGKLMQCDLSSRAPRA